MSATEEQTTATRKESHQSSTDPIVVSVPGWQRLTWLRAGFSTRLGGESTVYAAGKLGAPRDLNLGFTAHDDPALVARNRACFVQRVAGGAAMTLVTLRQIHGTFTHALDAQQAVAAAADPRAVLEGDGLMTGHAGLLLGIQTADCVPVLVADPARRVVAAFHAGWRGTLARIVEQGIASMHALYGSDPADLLAAIGPCIGGCCFAVGEEIRSSFGTRFPYGRELFHADAAGPGSEIRSAPPPLLLNLVEANRRQLLAAGLSAANIQDVAECTACSRESDGNRRYFSHRAEQGFTGRMMSVIGIVPKGGRSTQPLPGSRSDLHDCG